MAADLDREIDALERDGRLQGATLFAFGHTAATEQLRRGLLRHGRSLTAVLDNNPSKQGSSLGGVPVMPPDTITRVKGRSAVLIASRFYPQMRSQLSELHYRGDVLRIGDLSLATSSTDGACDLGLDRLEQLRSAHPHRTLLLCPFNALGDVYWALAYLPQTNSHPAAAPVPVVVGAGCAEVAALFGYDDVPVLEQTEMDQLVAAVAASTPPGVRILHHDRPYGEGAPVRVLDERFMAFTDIYRVHVHGLPDQALPRSPSAARRSPPRTLIAVGAPAGRTVLLAPYAKSVLSVPVSYWEQIARSRTTRGETVLTLARGDQRPVAGTAALDIPIAELIASVEYAGTVIALRSGLCDVMHEARATKTLVFPDSLYSTTPYPVADFFALPGWDSAVVAVS